MIRRVEIVFDIFPVFPGLLEDSNARRQRSCCSLRAEAPGKLE